MSEEDQSDAKTEEPTERRLSEAVEKANIPFSREAVLLGSILSTLAAGLLVLPWVAFRFFSECRRLLEDAGTLRLRDWADATHLTNSLSFAIGLPGLALALVLTTGGITTALLQQGLRLSTSRLKPTIERIDPWKGFGRIFGTHGLVEFAKSVVKLATIMLVAAHIVSLDLEHFLALLNGDPRNLPSMIFESCMHLLKALAIVSLLLTLVDLPYIRLKWRRDLRMTREELKEELKSSEGDMHMKALRRSKARQMSSRRMMLNLPRSTVVITNPTHYAVALRYERSEGGAPKVIAKGVDHMAAKIRQAAADHQIPLYENKPLARGLYEKVEVDDEIPVEFYKAVAEVIRYIEGTARQHHNKGIPRLPTSTA